MIDPTCRKVALAAAAVVALGTLSACGHGDSKASSGSSAGGNAPVADAMTALRIAAGKTGQQDSAKINGTTTLSGMSTTMNGAIDWSSGLTGRIGIKMTGGATASTGQLGDNGTIEALYTPDAMYMDMGTSMAQADGGKPWVKYSFDAMAKMAGGSGTALKEEMQNANPTLSVKLLIASGDVRAMGSETVDGTRTTHYSGVLDVDKMVGAQKGLDAATAKSMKTQLTAQGITTDHIDVWVDGNGLLVKKVENARTSKGTIDSTAFYSDYGVKVSVTPPPASKTEDAAAMMGAAAKG